MNQRFGHYGRRTSTSHLGRLALLLPIALGACFDEPTYGQSTNTNGVIFLETFGAGINPEAFSGTKLDALSIDTTVAHTGNASLRVDVPLPTDPSGAYAGSAFVGGTARDLSSYNALVFWAKASKAVTIDQMGIGNDNTGTSKYTATVSNVALTTDWKEYAIPIPDPKKLVAEKGLFFYAASAGASATAGYQFWMDDVQYQQLSSTDLGAPMPSIAGGSSTLTVGQTATVQSPAVAFSVFGQPETVGVMPGYFAFSSSNPSVATVGVDGKVTALAVGTTTISAMLESVAASQSLAVNVVAPDANVIALLSAQYPNVMVDKWLADWSMPMGKVAEMDGLAGTDPTKTYTNMQYVGVEFFRSSNEIDASKMNTFHIELQSPDATEVHFKLVDFGANGAADPPYDGTPHGDDSQGEVILSATSTPALVPGTPLVLDIPLTKFQVPYGMSPGLTNRGHLAQLVITGPAAGTPLVGSITIKNVYFKA
jgi:hypothetical protein